MKCHLIAVAVTLAQVGCSAPSSGELTPTADFYSPRLNIPISVDEEFVVKGGFLSAGEKRLDEVSPHAMEAAIGEMVDSYAAYWIASRAHLGAGLEAVRRIHLTVVADCTMQCSQSYNGMCSGYTDRQSWAQVALYSLVEQDYQPAQWPQAYLLPRTAQDLFDLSYGAVEWLSGQRGQYFYCVMPEGNWGLPALIHEWDHSLPNFDPHKPSDLARTLDLDLRSFVSGNRYVGAM